MKSEPELEHVYVDDYLERAEKEAREIARAEAQAKLAAVFLPEELDVRGMMHNKDGNRAVPFFYLNARAVMDRLEDVFGLNYSYSTQLEFSNEHKVVYRATISVDDYYKGINVHRDGIGEADVLWNKEGTRIVNDAFKSAESDALKRAAVSIGIGRYLYSIPQVWLPWEEEGYAQRQWGKFVDDPREFMFNEDGSIKASAIAQDTKGKAQRVAAVQSQQDAPVEAAKPATRARKAAEPAPAPPTEDVDSQGNPRRKPPVTVVPPATPISTALAGRRGQAPVAVPEEPVAREKPTGRDAPSEYFIEFLQANDVEIDPFATITELCDDIYNGIAPTVPNYMSAKQLGMIVSLCDQLEAEYPNNILSMSKGDAQKIIQALMKAKADVS